MTSKTMEAEFDFVGEGEKWNKSIGFEMSENRETPDPHRMAITMAAPIIMSGVPS